MAITDPRLPRYQQIRDAVAARIAAGEWRGGDAIATEAELAAVYKVAVGTVRRAVDELAADGLIERAQGRGMFVRRADFSTSLFRFFRLGSGTDRPIAPASRILLREHVEPPATVREKLALAPGDQSVRMVRLRVDGDRVLLREEIWLSARVFGDIVNVALDELMPLLYPAYERRFGRIVARAKERLSVETADTVVAHDLAISPGDTVVRVERLAVDHAGAPLEWRVSHGPADRFIYEVEIS